MLRALVILAALALPARSEVLVKWIEPAHTTYHHGIYDWWPAQFWIFEVDWNSDLGRWIYSQRQVNPLVWRETEVYVPPADEEQG